jgi:hypothetical protein
MKQTLRIIVVLTGLLFIGLGLRWLIDPTGSANDLGMPLLDGLGRSTQIGDLGAFFFSGGIMIMMGLLTDKRSWFYAPMLLVATTAVFRVIAWAFHDAAFASEQIAVEAVLTALLITAALQLGDKE